MSSDEICTLKLREQTNYGCDAMRFTPVIGMGLVESVHHVNGEELLMGRRLSEREECLQSWSTASVNYLF